MNVFLRDNNNRECFTATQARKASGLSGTYILHLLNSNRIEGFRVERDWFIYKDSLESFLSKPRKSGPRGGRKKQEAKDEQASQVS